MALIKRAAIYARFSSDNQREESITAQVRAIKEYSKKNNFIIVKIYVDEAISGRTDNRNGFLQMMDDVKKDIFDTIIVHKLDRFARNRYDSAIYKRKLQLNNIRLISVLEQLDDSPESIILESVLEGMSEYYSANLSREVMKGMTETALQCKHNGGKPPLGYDVAEDSSYVINEYEAESIKIIFGMYADGLSYRSIAGKLNDDGYRTQTGKKFDIYSFHDILKNEKYRGVYIFNRTKKQLLNGKRTHRQSKDQDQIIKIENGMPRIISDVIWNKVRDRMNNNKKGLNSSKEIYLLSGIISCGECGGAMVGNRRRAGRNKDWYITYECSTRKRTKECSAKSINKSFVEEVVIDDLLNTIFSDESIESVIKYYRELEKDFDSHHEKDLHMYTSRLSGIETSISNIISQIEKGFFHDSMNKRLTELEEEKIIVESKIVEVNNNRYLALPSEDKIIKTLKQYQNIKKIGLNDQKKIIQTYVSSVIICHDSIDINKIVDFNGGGGLYRLISTIDISSYRHK